MSKSWSILFAFEVLATLFLAGAATTKSVFELANPSLRVGRTVKAYAFRKAPPGQTSFVSFAPSAKSFNENQWALPITSY